MLSWIDDTQEKSSETIVLNMCCIVFISDANEWSLFRKWFSRQGLYHPELLLKSYAETLERFLEGIEERPGQGRLNKVGPKVFNLMKYTSKHLDTNVKSLLLLDSFHFLKSDERVKWNSQVYDSLSRCQQIWYHKPK